MADIADKRVTALWREAAARLEDAWTYSEEPVSSLHIGPCAECGRLREQLDAARQALDAAAAVATDVRRATYWEIGTGGGTVVAVQIPIAEWQALRAALGVEGEPA